MDVGDWASLGSTAIAAIALAASAWLSLRAARAAEKSAEHAGAAVAVARTQTGLAADSLRAAQDQAQTARAALDRADQPQFELAVDRVDARSGSASFLLSKLSGPGKIEIEMKYEASFLYKVDEEGDYVLSPNNSARGARQLKHGKVDDSRPERSILTTTAS